MRAFRIGETVLVKENGKTYPAKIVDTDRVIRTNGYFYYTVKAHDLMYEVSDQSIIDLWDGLTVRVVDGACIVTTGLGSGRVKMARKDTIQTCIDRVITDQIRRYIDGTRRPETEELDE